MRGYRILKAVALCLLSASCTRASSEELDAAPSRLGGRSGKGACYDRDREASETPTVCVAHEATYVMGLPRNHNWSRGSRVIITQADDPIEDRPIAIAWVSDAHSRAVRIHAIIQEPGASIEGGIARINEPDRFLRFKNFYAHAERLGGGRLLLDVGSNDGVAMHDLYEARDPSRADFPIGRVRVDRIYANSAEAVVVEGGDELGGQHEFVLSRAPDSSASSEPSSSSIRVAVLQVRSKTPPTMGPVPRASGHDLLLDLLRQAKKRTESFELLLQDLQPEREDDPNTLHQRIAARARDERATQVIWTTDTCTGEPCAFAWHAAVPADPADPLTPEPLLLAPSRTTATASDTSAVLGQIAYTAESFDEASYHLRSSASLQPAEVASETLIRLAEAEHALGQLDRARMWLRQANERISSNVRPEQVVPYFLAWANVACAEENPNELDNLQRNISRHVYALPELRRAQLTVAECKVTASMRTSEHKATAAMVEAGLALARDLGDQDAISRFETFKGQLFELTGQFEQGEQHLQQAQAAAEAAGDRKAQANISLARAKNRILVGDFPFAQQHAQMSLDLYKSLQNESGIAECLPVLVRIHRRLRGAEAARQFLEAERSALKRRRLPRAELALRLASAYLELQRGDLARTDKLLKQIQVSARKFGQLGEEVQILGMTAELFLLSGKTQQAQKTIDRYWRRATELNRQTDLARAKLLYAEFRLQEGNSKDARRQAERASEHFRRLNDHVGIATAELVRGDIEREFGDAGVAKAHYLTAKSLFEQVQDIDGLRLADLGLAMLGLWREGAHDSRHKLTPILRHFQLVGNEAGRVRTNLQLDWANFLHSRERTATLQSLKSLRDTAKRKQFAAFEAEAQMLIACVHRVDSDHKAANQEFQLAKSLYAALGRHTQSWPCEVAGDSPTLTAAAVQHAGP